MKTYSDLQAINQRLLCHVELEPVGTPEVAIIIAGVYGGGKLFQPAVFDISTDLFEPFTVEIELKNKTYTTEYETAVIIKQLQIDGIDIVPRFDYLAVYDNDHNNKNPTSYLGFNGKWTLTFDRPFYQWLHQATGQGWLIS
jgi:hypothetical protein